MLLVLPLALSLAHPRPDEPGGDVDPLRPDPDPEPGSEPGPKLAPASQTTIEIIPAPEPESAPQAAATPSPAEPPQTCGRDDCPEPARWKPTLLLRPHRPVKEPIRIEVGMAVCDGHRGGFDDYLNAESYRGIQEMFTKAGQPRPVRHRCSVEHTLIPGR